MKRILILQNTLLHYRKALYNELSLHYDVTVLHSGEYTVLNKDLYKEMVVKTIKIGSFYFQSKVIKEVRSNNYDIIVAMFDLGWVNNLLAFYFHNSNSNFIWWGAWITENKIANKIRLYLTKKAKANIFYTKKAKEEFVRLGVVEKKLFVANNTFDVGKRIKCYENEVKNSILFVGSLNARKQNKILIKAFFNILKKIPKDVNLMMIGSGKEKENLLQLVSDLKIENRVSFRGHIVDPKVLLNFYKEAIVSVSYGQAGLTVLQSLGYGVPFITKKNAISGGEKTNIINEYNGLFCDDDLKSLEDCLVRLCNNHEYARKMGKNAYNYYSEFCTIKKMAQGFIEAIKSSY